jgi:hypothetical protein
MREGKAVSAEGKPLHGAAKNSFMARLHSMSASPPKADMD